MRIALLEDEPNVTELMTLWLSEQGHTVTSYASGELLINALRRETYDLLVLDWMVPDVDGEKVLAWVREHVEWAIPVIFVTQRDEEEDIVRILTQGADDYLVKPVRQRELQARIAALARRANLDEPQTPVLEFAPYSIDTQGRAVHFEGRSVQLTQKELDLACFLFRNAGRILSRDHILESVWGHRPGMNTRTVDTHISRLRSKLDLSPTSGWRLTGIYHHGYRLEHLTDDSASGSDVEP